ncbi:hypothetical protein [Cycloclasticus sp. PY97N]|uniref:hypothetical protein n=1 Tax=Cycloclasticus sp. PY97N TaxID=728003 RepID=UPI0013B46443|nr:hypothetical protein [Cycloclasticus sp. PY97N]
MRTAKYRQLIVALLMMAFIGQVVASTSMSCQSMSAPLQAHELMMDSGMMDHSQHMGSNAFSLDGAATADCCPDCDCSLGGCSSVALPACQSIFSSSLKSITGHYDESADFQLAVSLFRPPISR